MVNETHENERQLPNIADLDFTLIVKRKQIWRRLAGNGILPAFPGRAADCSGRPTAH
jgi:hypothetical protein